MAEENMNESNPADEQGFADQTDESKASEKEEPAAEQGFADMGDKPEGEAPKEEGESEGKPSEEQKPEEYELTAPENLPLPEENLKSFTEACLKAGLTKDQAGAMLEWHGRHHQAVQEYNARMWGDTLKGWSDELASDVEFGGSHLKDTYGYALKALNAFDDEQGSLRAMLRETKYQFNPTIIRAFARVGRALGEHGFVGQRGEGSSESRSLADRFAGDVASKVLNQFG